MKKKLKKTKKIHAGWWFLFLLPLFLFFFSVLINEYKNKPQQACANSISCIKNLSGKYEQEIAGIFMGKKITAPSYIAREPSQAVLGETTEPKVIKIDLATQTLYAYEGNRVVYKFLVSTGKWAATPTGIFDIWIKLRYTRMSGGNPAIGTYYNLPNVPYTMFFSNNEISKSKGFSIHGAYWHDNFGYPMSHGCINMKISEAEKVFYWARPYTGGINPIYSTEENPGTKVIIYGEAPIET